MSNPAGWLLLIMGIGLTAVALQGAVRGWLPNGPKGYQRGEGVSRADNPVGFWFFFVLYFAGGLYVAFHAVRLLSGPAA